MANNPLQWFKTETREDKTYVFDPLRKRMVLLTPEEEVRQKVLYLLVEHLRVPAGLVAVARCGSATRSTISPTATGP